MARKKPDVAPDEVASQTHKTYSIRLQADLSGEVDSLADALGLDNSNFIRMVLKENLFIYRQRVAQMRERQGLPPEA